MEVSQVGMKEVEARKKIDQKLPVKKLVPLGIQHVLAMYAGAVLVPLIVGGALKFNSEQMTLLVAADLFTCGIATLIQSVGIGKFAGIKLPVVLGVAFTAVGPMIAIGLSPAGNGPTDIYGAIIASGVFVMLASFFFTKIVRFFPPVVTGTVVVIIGLSLITVGVNNAGAGPMGPFAGVNPDGTNQYAADFGDPKHLLTALITLATILVLSKYAKGFLNALSVLGGLIVGTVAAFILGLTNFQPVSEAGWFHIVSPFFFGAPTFSFGPILTMCIVGIVSMIESTGVFFGLGKVCEVEVDGKDVGKGIRAEGIAQILGGIFNSFPYTTFSQNVGLVVLTGIRSRYVTMTAGILLIVLGLLPKFAAIATIIPNPVLGGAMIAMFGMVAASGIRMLGEIDLSKITNLLIVAVSIAVGLGASVVTPLFGKLPEWFSLLFGSGIVSGSFTAIFLNLFFNFKDVISGKNERTVHVDDSVF